MTDLELLKAKLEEAKENLEAKGWKLGEDGELMDLFPAMKQYEYAFQSAIEDVWPEQAWWQVTNYWDIFQDSIMTGKTADEVIQDILDHIELDDTESKSEEDVEPQLTTDDMNAGQWYESLEEDKKEIKVSDSVFELLDGLEEGE